MNHGKIVTIEERIPKLKEERRRKANRRLILYLSIFFLLILLVIYFQSPFSRVGKIIVQGNHYVTESEIIAAANLSTDTSFWNLKKKDLERELVNAIPQLSSATIAKHIPNTISIQVTEYPRIAYLKEGDRFFPVLANGEVIDVLSSDQVPVNAPIFVGWKKENLEEMARELMKLPQSIIQRISEIHFSSSEEDSSTLTLYMNDGFEVRTTIRNFAEKMQAYPSIVREIGTEKKGIIHLDVGAYFEEYGGEGASEREGER